MYTNYTSTQARKPAQKQARRQTSASISRLMAAAVINARFRNLLLSRPEQALREGFQGEAFNLNRSERNLILSIQAVDLADFAVQLMAPRVERHPEPSGYWIPVSQQAVVLDAE
jgi:hypothetical protein